MDRAPAEPKNIDRIMMQRCIALAMRASDQREYPYAAVISRKDEIVCEAINSVRRDRNPTHHAEYMAMAEALRRLGRVSLEDCTIYSNAEPCAYCCYAMRETRIGRVVFGLPAPLSGGVTRWKILNDTELSDAVPEVFAPPPEIVSGFMQDEVGAAIARQSPLVWQFIRSRNFFGGPVPHDVLGPLPARPERRLREYAMSFLRRWVFDYFGRR